MRCWRRSRTCVGRTVTNAGGATSVLHGAGGNLEGFSGPSWYGSGRAKERSAGVAVAVRILSPPAGVVVNPERSIPCTGLTACHSRLPTATCRRLPRPHRSCGVSALQCSSPGVVRGRRSYVATVAEPHSTVACTRHHLPSGREVRGRGPPPGAGAEGRTVTPYRSNPQGSTRMVMVAERNDAGMRRRARRDQNDREEKAETMRQESRNQPSIPGGGARSRRPPPRVQSSPITLERKFWCVVKLLQ